MLNHLVIKWRWHKITNTQLDEVKIFIDTIDATTSINHAGNKGSIKDVGAGNKIFVHEPEIANFDTYLKKYIHRYELELLFDTEANLTTAINALITNINKFERRTAIAGYTKPSSLYHIYLVNVGSMYKGTKNWNCNLAIEFEWGI